MRRARAACERLVLLAADRYPEERRDLAIILLHSGDVPAARRELRAYMAAVNASANSGSGLGVGAGEEAEGLEAEPLSVEATLRLPPPWERAHGGGGGGQALPLTW
eukprot:XP_001695735.1 predicted protein [Chlamydomonas reinhardtii]